MITASALDDLPRIRHGFFTRAGGVSEGIFAGLNCGYGSGDSPEKVTANRARAMARLGLPATALVTVYQAHTAEAATVDDPWPHDQAPTADALVTVMPGLALGILTADCAPVLLADATAGVIGAAHAGWKGAIGGVLENTIAAMEALGATRQRITAAIGPCIAGASYEVGSEFPVPFLAADAQNRDFFVPAARAGHWLFDLPGFVGRRLRQAGAGEVLDTACDTLADEDRFFSYRRTTLGGSTAYGRQLSAIALEP